MAFYYPAKKYDPAMCETVVSVMSRGGSFNTLAQTLGVCTATVYTWECTYPEFEHALALGRLALKRWYEDKALENLDNPQFNTKLFERLAINCAGWSNYRTTPLRNLKNAKKHTEQISVINEAISNGEITPDEAMRLASTVAIGAKVTETTDFQERLEALERRES